MQQAGAKIALSVLGDFKEIGGLPPQARLLVLVGKGHNGGDALLAAKVILEKYSQATADVLLCLGEAALRPLARRALNEFRAFVGQRACTRQLGEESASKLADLLDRDYDLCLDGIFGYQFRPPMDDAIAQLLSQVNAHPRIRFRAAVDLPSGVGEVSASTVFRADFTYATGIVKLPVLQPANATTVGRLRYLDLGFFPVERVAPNALDRVLLPLILAPLTELRPSQSDKRTFGHLFVVGGSLSYPGAVVLAVRAALRSGVGLVTAFVPESLVPEYAARHPEAMWVGGAVNRAGGLGPGTLALVRERLARANALLIGPGLGADADTMAAVTQIVREVAVPLVLDADALRPEVIAAAGSKPFIATPHAGEYQRLGGRAGLRPALGGPLGAEIVTVLKGPITRIIVASGRSETGPTYHSPFGGPVLARGGSGDILAGLIGGLLAQKPDAPLLAACRGVVWHGQAADLLARASGQGTVETSQLLEQLGPALSADSCQTH